MSYNLFSLLMKILYAPSTSLSTALMEPLLKLQRKRREIMKETVTNEKVEVLTVEQISQILRVSRNTIQSTRWKQSSRCPLIKRGKRIYAVSTDFWKWFRT